MRLTMYRLLTLWQWSFGWRVLEWPSLTTPIKELYNMSTTELDSKYQKEFGISVRKYKQSDFLPSLRGEIALARCVLLVNRLSELQGGPNGKVFMRSVRHDLERQIFSHEGHDR